MQLIRKQTPRDKLISAKTHILTYYPFWGHLLAVIKLQEYERSEVRTTAISLDGTLYYSKEWIEKMSRKDVVFEICHEVMHLVQKATARFPKGGKKDVWNLAADYRADTDLVESGFTQSEISKKMVPSNIQASVRGKSIEEVYKDLLADEELSPGSSSQKNKRSCCSGTNNPSSKKGKGGEEEIEFESVPMTAEQAQYWREKVVTSATRQKARGNLPGPVRDLLALITEPSIRWTDHLRNAAKSALRNKYTFQRPGRRSHSIGMRLMSKKHTRKVPVLFFDGSGSISTKEFEMAASEAIGILRASGANKVHVFFHDTRCYHHEYYDLDSLKNNLKKTNAGTSHRDVFKVAEEVEQNIGMVVAFTDLETTFPSHTPSYPVLWVRSKGRNNIQPPFGRVLEMTT